MPSREASLENLEKARANRRQPRPWRCSAERRLIRMFAWQWLLGHGPWCSGRKLAQWLGVSHTYIQKLSRTLSRDESDFLREVRCYGGPSREALRRAREESRRERERGLLRTQPRFKWAQFKVGDNVVRAPVPTTPNAAARVAQNPTLPDPPGSPQNEGRLDYNAIHMWNLKVNAAREWRPVRFRRRWRPGMRHPPGP
jgi:hypothetical protein